MATALLSAPHAEDRTLLREVTWETYVRLCDENGSPAAQLAYFEGDLEIMTVGRVHESAKGKVFLLIALGAESLGIDLEDTGQHTYQHPGKRIGFEADLSFYTTNLEAVRRKTKLNLAKDPPPDLVVEIDVSRNSTRKLLMYAALGVREVWRCEGLEIRMYRLTGREYKAVSKSTVLGGVGAALLTRLLADAAHMTHPNWLRHVRKSVAAKPGARPDSQ